MPRYIYEFDVCLNPQVINDVTIGNYPRKIDEYLAMGKPVVATLTEGMDLFTDHVYLPTTKEGYLEKIQRALDEDSPELQAGNIRFAGTHTWENHVEPHLRGYSTVYPVKIMSIAEKIKSNPSLKKLFLWLMIPSGEYRPRLWIKWFVNPFKHNKGKGAIVRHRTRTDVFPYNKFDLGTRSIIEDFSTINNGVGDVIIGDRTIIGIGNVIIGPVQIGNGVMFAQNIVVSGLNHGYQDVHISPSIQPVETKQITIRDDVWIGANCVITAGVTIGKHAVIGAGSVVTKDIPAYCVAVGNPARVVKNL